MAKTKKLKTEPDALVAAARAALKEAQQQLETAEKLRSQAEADMREANARCDVLAQRFSLVKQEVAKLEGFLNANLESQRLLELVLRGA